MGILEDLQSGTYGNNGGDGSLLSALANAPRSHPLTLMALGGGIAQHGMGGFANAVPAAQYEQQLAQQRAAQQAALSGFQSTGLPQKQALAATLNPQFANYLNQQQQMELAKQQFEFQKTKPVVVPYGAEITNPVTGQPLNPEGNSIKKQASDIADAIVAGKQPPTLTGLGRQVLPAVRQELGNRGFDLATANLDYERAHKQVISLNGPQMVRYAGLTDSVDKTIDEVRDLSQQMRLGGVPLLNKAELAAYIQARGNSPEGQLATRYLTAVNTLKEEFANLAQGGYAPTEPAWKLAEQQINGNYGQQQLDASLTEVQRLIRYRKQAIPNFNTLGPGGQSRYMPGAAAPAGTPAAPTAPTAPVIKWERKPDGSLGPVQ